MGSWVLALVSSLLSSPHTHKNASSTRRGVSRSSWIGGKPLQCLFLCQFKVHVKLQQKPSLSQEQVRHNWWVCNLYFWPTHPYRGSWVQNSASFIKESCLTDAFSDRNMFKEKSVDIITWLICIQSWLFTPFICLHLMYFPHSACFYWSL